MKSGFIISGVLHIVLLLAAVFNLPWLQPDPFKELEVTDVSVISEAEFSAQQSSEPEISTDLTSIFAPTIETNDAERPDVETQVVQTVQDVTEAPTEQDDEADLSAVVTRVADPEVAVATQSIVTPAPVIDTAPTFGLGVDGDSQVASLAPSVPRTADRVAPESSLGLPSIDTSSDRNIEETTSDREATEPEPEETPSSTEDSVTEIEPEAVPDAPLSAAPPIAQRPPQRSNRIPDIQAAIEEASAPVEDEPTPTPEETEDSTVDDLFSQIEDVPNTEPTASAPQLTGAQQGSIGAAIGQNWNITRIYGIENYEQFVVRVSVLVDIDGNIIGPVEPVEPSAPSGGYQLAFEIARVAIQRTGQIPVPPGTLTGDTNLVLRFDPATGVGF